MKVPDWDGLLLVQKFLNRCEEAAKPPPLPPAPVFGGLLAPRLMSPGTGVLGSVLENVLKLEPHPRTLQDVLRGKTPPFQTKEVLAPDREARIKTLEGWLHRFPAFESLKREPALQGGFRAFQNVSRRRKDDPRFNDDCAYFRYWSFAVEAMSFTRVVNKPEPDAEQRKIAAAAAKRLLAIASKTRLDRAAGIEYDQWKVVKSGLESLLFGKTSRRKRFDAYTGDRAFIKFLAWYAEITFGFISPAIVYEVAALKVQNPDKAAITKQVSEFKRSKV
jgi:hypothetical protein